MTANDNNVPVDRPRWPPLEATVVRQEASLQVRVDAARNRHRVGVGPHKVVQRDSEQPLDDRPVLSKRDDAVKCASGYGKDAGSKLWAKVRRFEQQPGIG